MPNASYYFADDSTDVEFGNAVDWLIAQHVDIISSSTGFPALGPGDGTGPIDQIIDRAYNAGILWSQAAGNYAQTHWSGPWVNTNGNQYLDFNISPLDEGNSVQLNGGETIQVKLSWNDVWGASANDYDLLLFDDTSHIVAGSVNVQNGNSDPYESFTYTATYTGLYSVAIGTLGHPSPKSFHLFMIYPNPNLPQYFVAAGSLFVPADSTHVLTVGAVPWNNPSTIEPFSSQGPNISGVIKPDLVAPDFVSTVTYGVNGFPGTSAAAPCAAGAAAIVKQVNPTYTRDQLKAYLEGHAVDLGTAGKDNIFGSGRLLLGNPPGKISFTTPPQTKNAGTVSNLTTIQSQDSSGNPLNVVSSIDIDLTSSSTTGRFDISTGGAFNGSITKITIPAGSNSASFYYKDTTSGSPIITATSTGIATITQQDTITAGTATQIKVETAANGSGTVVGVQNLSAGNSLTVYGVTRDQYSNFVGNPANTAWSLTNKTIGVADTDLGASPSASATLTGHLAGTAVIHAVNGSLTPGDSGTITVIKSAFDHLQINTQPASTLSVDSPLSTAAVVKACDAGNNPLSGVSIAADRDPATGTGVLRGTLTVTTDVNGLATFSNLAYNKIDTFKVRFTSGAKTIISNQLGPLSAGTATAISVFTAPAIGASVDANLATQPVILVVDQFANPKNGTVVTATRGTGTGTLRGTLTATSDANGKATFSDLGYNKSGEAFTLHFAAGSLSVNSASLGPVAAGAATQIRVETAANGSGTTVGVQNLSAGNTLTVYGVTRDQYNNYVGNPIDTAWSLSHTGGVADTDLGASPSASVTLTGHLAGTAVIHAVNGSLTPGDSGTITVIKSAFDHLRINTQPASTLSVDSPFNTAAVVTACDAGNNPLSGVSITADRDPATGTGPLRGTLTVTTDVNGLATFSNLAYNKIDTFKVRFTSGAKTIISNQIGPLSAGAATAISVFTAPIIGASVDAVLATQPVILVVDQFANPKNGTVVTAARGTGTGALRGTLTATSDANGKATFTDLGYNKSGEAFTIHFTAGSLSVNSASLGPIAAGAATTISVFTAPIIGASVDAPLATQPVILVVDQFANPKNGITVTAARGTGTGTLRGTLTATSDANGKATFNNLGYNKSGETFSIHFTAGNLFTDSSDLGPVTAGTATAISVFTAPIIGASVDNNLATQPVILVVDQFANPKNGTVVTATRGTGTGTLRGTLTATSDANGKATFSDLGYNKSGEAFTLHFAAGSLSVNSASLGPVAAGAATQIRVETAANGSGTTVGAQNLSAGNTLTVYGITRDQYGNFVDNPANTSWGLYNITGGVDGGNDFGVAVDLRSASITGHLVGTAVIHAASGSLTPGDSGTITVIKSAFDHLQINTQPASTLSVDSPLSTAAVVKACDAGNNPLSGVSIAADRDPATGTGVLRGTLTVTTDVNGLATFSNLAYNKIDTFKVRFTSGAKTIISNQTGPLSAGAATAISIFTAPIIGASVDANLATQPVILVVDQFANPKNGTVVTAARGTGTGTLGGTLTVSSNATGMAAFTDLGYNKSGEAFTLHFAAGSLSVNSASLGPIAAGTATRVRVETAANGAGTIVGAQVLVAGNTLKVYGVTRDQYNNFVGNPANTDWSLIHTGNVADTDLSPAAGANATLTANLAGTAVIHAVNGPLTPGDSGTITINMGPPTLLSIFTAPAIGASVDDNFTTQPVILVTDSGPNPVSGITITASRGTGTGTLRGTLTVTSNASGEAAFTDLGYNKSGEPFTIHFVAGSLSVNSSSLGPISAGAATTISVSTAPIIGASVDANLATQPVILVVDQFSNPKNGTDVTAARGTGTGTLRGTLTATSDANGKATFTNLGYNKSGEAFTIHFTAGSLSINTASLGPLSPGAATTISVSTAPVIGASVDMILATQPVILVADQFSNPKSGTAVTAARGTGTGILRGTLAVSSNATGLAAFTNLGYNKSGETFTIHFTAGSLFTDSSDLGPIDPGTATAISIFTAPVMGASVDANLATQPVILVVDQFSNPKNGTVVTTTRGTGTGTLRGTLTATSDASGKATFSDLGYNKSGEAFTLHFAAGSLSVNSASLGPIAAGAATQVRVETAANGSGTIVGIQNLSANTTLEVFGVTRDQYNNYIGNPKDTTWSLTNKTDGVADADLSPASGASAILTANLAGTAVIHAVNGSLTPSDSGTIFVTLYPPILTSISVAPVVGASVDDLLAAQPVIMITDKFDSPIGGVSITASRGTGTGTLRGTLISTSDATGLATFTDLGYNKSGEDFTIHFAAGSLSVDSSPIGPITAGAPTQIRVETSGSGSGTILSDQNLTIGNSLIVYDVARDQYSNFVNNPVAHWSLISKTGGVVDSDLSTASGTSEVLTGHQAGSGVIDASIVGLTSIDSGVITVAAPVSYGGGGGGGGSAIINLNIEGFASSEPLKTNSDGVIQETAKIKSADGMFTLDIAKGTKVLSKILTAVVNLSVEPLTSPAKAPSMNAFVAAYTFAPEGTTFNPPITFTFSYSSLPANMDENTLTVVYYNGTSWDTVPGKLDTGTNTITAQIRSFSSYAVIGRIGEPMAPTPTPTPTSTRTPTPTPTLTETVTPSPTQIPTPTPTATPSPSASVSAIPAPLIASPTAEVTPTPAQTSAPTATPPTKSNPPWRIIMFVVLGIAAVLAAVLIIVRVRKTKT